MKLRIPRIPTSKIHLTNTSATVIAVCICVIIYIITHIIEVSTGTKLIIGINFILFLTILIGGASIMSIRKKDIIKKDKPKPDSLMDEVKGIIANVPENHIWVLRNIWKSNPERPYPGYYAKEEGISIFIPSVWHDEVKLVSLVPLQRDPSPVEVNTKDNILPLVDYRTKTWVAQNKIGKHKKVKNAATKFALRVTDRVELEDQWIQKVLNDITAEYYSSKPDDSNDPDVIGLTEMDEGQLNALTKKITEKFNEEMDHFGIQGEISIHNIRSPQVVEAAASQVVVSKLREKASGHEAAAMKKVINKTGIKEEDIKWVVISEAISNIARGLVGAAEQKTAEKREKTDE